MSARYSAEIRFAADHPTATGHFPGNPIIPGAVLLEEVLHAIGAVAGTGTAPAAMRAAKFLRPVRPGDRMLIHWERRENGEIRFECVLTDPERPVLTGALASEPTAR